jgi:hypothetical protein
MMKTTFAFAKLRHVALLLLLLFSPLAAAAQSTPYGDVNHDGEVTVADVNYVIDIILGGTGDHQAADVNHDNEVTIADINAIIDIILHPTQIPEDVHIYGDTPGSEGKVWMVTDDVVVVSCPPGEEPEVGDVIVSGITEYAPYGFLRRVESVDRSRGQCVMTTTNASLEEVLPDGDYHIDIPLVLPGQQSTFYSAADAPSRVKFSTDFKGTVKIGFKGDVPDIKFDLWPFMTPEQEKKKEDEVLNGTADSSYPLQFITKLSPSLGLTFDCQVKKRTIQRVELGGELEVKAELLLKATLEKEFKRVGEDGLMLPGSIDMAPVTVMAGPVPVVFTPKLHFSLGVDLKGELYMQFKLMSATASGSFSYVYTHDPDPVTGQKHNFYKNFETSTLGDGDMEKRFQKWLAPKVGVSGSAKGILSPMPDVSVYNANDIFHVSVPLSPWAKVGGNLSITLDPSNSSELDYEDNVTITGGADIGIAAVFKLFGKKEVWEKDFTLFETQLMEPFALTPRFEDLLVTPDDDPIPATTPAIGFGAYMTKPNIQVLPDQDYGFAYGPKDAPNRTATWTFVSLKEQYDPEFDGDWYKHQYIQTAIDPATVEPGVPYRVSPYLQLFGYKIFKKGENFTLDDATPCVTVSVAEVDFGDVLVGYSPTQILEIDNSSSVPQTVTVEVTPPFSIAHNESSMLSLTVEVAPNSCYPVTIMFPALSEGDYLGTATFTSNAIEGGSITVPLHGHAVSGQPSSLAVSTTVIDFGVVKLGTDKQKTLTVTNTSDTSVTFKVDASTMYTGRFEVSDNLEDVTLASGDSKIYTVTSHGQESGYDFYTEVYVIHQSGDTAATVKLLSIGDDDKPLIGQTSLILSVGESATVHAKTSHLTSEADVEGIVDYFGHSDATGGGRIDGHHSISTQSSLDITFRGLKAGVTTITFRHELTGETATLKITVFGADDNHEWVDLGLPSGTLWATCNVGASAPEEYGDYFAWGETEPKDYYDKYNYKWWYYPGPFFTKYYTGNCFDGIVDNKTELDPEDDAAYVNWGPLWRMPSRKQVKELLYRCSWEWTTRNGVNGELVTGPNGKTLFLPAAGYRENDEVNKVGEWGMYWSHTLGTNDASAYWLRFKSDIEYCDIMVRYGGFSVRAVRVSRQNESLRLPKREELPIDKTVLLDILNGRGSIESYTEAVDRLLRE